MARPQRGAAIARRCIYFKGGVAIDRDWVCGYFQEAWLLPGRGRCMPWTGQPGKAEENVREGLISMATHMSDHP